MHCNKKSDFTKFQKEVSRHFLQKWPNRLKSGKLIEKSLLRDYHFIQSGKIVRLRSGIPRLLSEPMGSSYRSPEIYINDYS